MRKLIGVGAAVVAAASVYAWTRPTDLSGHPLIGSWEAAPMASGFLAPHILTFHPDGTGRDASGVGNFDSVWRPVGRAGDLVRVRVTLSGASARAGVPWEDDVQLVSPQAIRIRGQDYARRP